MTNPNKYLHTFEQFSPTKGKNINRPIIMNITFHGIFCEVKKYIRHLFLRLENTKENTLLMEMKNE